MDRKEFLKVCGLLGISLPFQGAMGAWDEASRSRSSFSGKVLIIGAGAAGMTAGYLLRQQGIDFEIVEAAPTYGGRIKQTKTFTDFPIPLGGEWLHTGEKILTQIVNNSSVEIATQMKGYKGSDQVGYFENGELSYSPLLVAFGPLYKDKKFVGSSWLSFFEEYILPSVADRIQFNTEITAIDYTANQVTVTDRSGQTRKADKVVVTVPLKMLQNKAIAFSPALPNYKTKALEAAKVWSGIKVFIEFNEPFFPTALIFRDSETKEGQRMYYDAAYGQDTDHHILGLFSVGQQAERYQQHCTKDKIDYILKELDEVFDGKATASYVKHIVQNWNEEPFIGGAYLNGHSPVYISKDLYYSIDDKVYFAGTSYTREADWGSVHNAARSAMDAVAEIAG